MVYSKRGEILSRPSVLLVGLGLLLVTLIISNAEGSPHPQDPQVDTGGNPTSSPSETDQPPSPTDNVVTESTDNKGKENSKQEKSEAPAHGAQGGATTKATTKKRPSKPGSAKRNTPGSALVLGISILGGIACRMFSVL